MDFFQVNGTYSEVESSRSNLPPKGDGDIGEGNELELGYRDQGRSLN